MQMVGLAHPLPRHAARLLEQHPDLAPDHGLLRGTGLRLDQGLKAVQAVVEHVCGEFRAFGSGGHSITVLALEALWDEPLDGAFVLDVGTVSGVLAIAAVHRGAARVLATDIDPHALEVCTANAVANGVAARLLAVAEPVHAFATTFDTVVANMLAVTLRELAPDLTEVVVPGGSLVLSGMLDAQLDDVVAAFVETGCSLRAVRRRDGWVAAVLDRDDPEHVEDDLGEDWFTDPDAW